MRTTKDKHIRLNGLTSLRRKEIKFETTQGKCILVVNLKKILILEHLNTETS